MEVSIFPRPDVAKQLKKYVEVRLHTDKANDDSKKFQEYKVRLTSSQSNPIYVIVDPDAPEKVIGKFVGADLSGKRFRDFLEKYAKGD